MRKIVSSQMVRESAIQVNNRIEVARADDEMLDFGHSLIQQVFDNSFSIMVPLFEGNLLNFRVNDEVIVSVLINNVRYSFRTKVISKIREDNLSLLVLKMPQSLEPADRRTLVRIKTLLPVKYTILEAEQKSAWQSVEPDQEAYLTDLSGKGLSISLEKMPAIGEWVVLNLNLGNGTVMKVLGEVVRGEKFNKRFRVGIRFEEMTERQEDLIISYVFQCLRKTIRLNKED